MAYYAALVSAVQSLEKINNGDQCSKLFLDKKQVASIHEKLSHLQALLEDYSPEDEAIADCLERRIGDAACQVQDTLDDCFLISKLKREMPCQLQDMGKVKEEVDFIVEELTRMKIKKNHTTEDLRPTTYYPASKQESISCGDTTVGFEERLITIKDQLCGESSKLEVVPLVGMGGIGKTTLARSSFYDKLIVDRFDCRAWVTVSQDYHVQKAFVDILKSLKVDMTTSSGVDEGLLAEYIYKHLKGRRYLIIMDDVWDTKVWDDLKRVFPDDNNGSRIVLTTRLFDVAVYANKKGSFYQMQFLNEDQSWNLLRDKVFAQEECPRELEVIGRFIARSCRGLPLAIVVVAGFLSKVSKARDDWEEIARNVSSTATENDENFSKILSLSYNRLPHRLKPCFLYMGVFLEDYQMPVSRLVKLWVAEGFLSQDESKSLEEVGEGYLEDLVKRNLVLVTRKKSNGKFKYCSIHDVLRELCVQRAHNENFFHVMDDNDYLYTEGTRNIIRRLCIHSTRSRITKVEEFGSHIGSILFFGSSRRLLSFALGFKLLTILNALELYLSSFPVEVLELSCLRYLALGRFGSSSIIPPGIAKLENLQTIVLPYVGRDGCSFEIWKMPNLRHVIIWNLQLPSPISFAHVLQNLQTLSRVVNFSLSNRVIEMIPNLKKLKVEYRTNEPTENWEKFCLFNLVLLCQLETLDIIFNSNLRGPNLPEYFAFPQKLKKLSLDGCRLPWGNMTVVGSLPHLEVLKLKYKAFVGDEWEPVEGEFSQLKFLLMQDLGLKYWRAENTHFPRLEQLKIDCCVELEEIPPGIGDIPTLELIEVRECKNAAYSALKIQDEQRELENPILQVDIRLLCQTFNPPDDLPNIVARILNQGSSPMSMDFHPNQQTLLLVGTNVGDIGLWEVGFWERLVQRNFKVWDPTACSVPSQGRLVKDPSVSVNRVIWSPDGSLFGAAYSRHLVQLYSYHGNDDVRQHLEIDAHVGGVNDLAFSHPNKQLSVITCGDDKLIKVWDATTGANQYTFEGHEEPVYSVCPHQKENIQFIFSSALDGKIKVWLYDNSGSRVDYGAPGRWCATMAYNADGTRLFFCGTSKDGESHIIEWNESEGAVKRTYQGFRKRSLGIVQFDTIRNRFLAAGDDFSIKFWDMDNVQLLTSIDSDGDLPASPRIRFNKDGTLLAISTNKNRIKILANADGFRLLQISGNLAFDA